MFGGSPISVLQCAARFSRAVFLSLCARVLCPAISSQGLPVPRLPAIAPFASPSCLSPSRARLRPVPCGAIASHHQSPSHSAATPPPKVSSLPQRPQQTTKAATPLSALSQIRQQYPNIITGANLRTFLDPTKQISDYFLSPRPSVLTFRSPHLPASWYHPSSHPFPLIKEAQSVSSDSPIFPKTSLKTTFFAHFPPLQGGKSGFSPYPANYFEKFSLPCYPQSPYLKRYGAIKRKFHFLL